MAPDKEATSADWRELAQRIQKEQDPDKVLELVQQLIVKFEEEKQGKGLRPLGSYDNDKT